MAFFRRSGALLLLTALVGLVPAATAPLAATSCERKSGCPVCPMMAKRGAPCHAPASGGMTAPIGCCESRVAAALAVASVTMAPAPALAAVAAAAVVPPVFELPARWVTNRHTLGLFTLHSVWRI